MRNKEVRSCFFFIDCMLLEFEFGRRARGRNNGNGLPDPVNQYILYSSMKMGGVWKYISENRKINKN